MSRTHTIGHVARALRLARLCEVHRVQTAEAIERLQADDRGHAAQRATRREWLRTMGRVGAGGLAWSVSRPVNRVFASGGDDVALNVGIVGAGLAGLVCGDELAAHGVRATLYDANTRTGGRCWSLRGTFPGQVAERGGEFIDNAHKTLLKYAQRFNLAIEDVSRQPGDVFYHFGGQLVPESAVVDEFREFVRAMHVDLRAVSGEVTADNHTAADEQLDRTSLIEYLAGDNGASLVAAPVAREAIIQAYVAEYGLDPWRQSCLNFLLFMHADKRSKFTPFGISSDERWHVLDGNDRIVEGLTQSLAGQIELGLELVRVRKTSSGAIQLTFRRGSRTLVRTHDVVVLAIPFTVLRDVELDGSLGLSPEKRAAIALLGYGTNAKMLLGFGSRPWAAQGSSGASYSDLDNHQATWETNPSRAGGEQAILTDYAGGARGASLNPRTVQSEAELFLTDLDRIFPGALGAASRDQRGRFLVHLEHWPSNPLSQGSYTCYLPGQFTTIAGVEGKPAGNVFFAGEHTNSFYEWQGFMEGAALSGVQAASEILQRVRG